MVDALYKKGVSSNYNEPMTKEQLNRLSEYQLQTIAENCYITNNLVNIQQVKGEDLEIKNTDKYDYILTYSFPCQDLSLAGKGKGMSDTSTRSGMLWEVERILQECKDIGQLPQVLLMENVPQVHGADNVKDFNKWQLRLEQLGYKNYWQDLIATDYGIPQTRNRTFMVSILGDYSYTFPKPIPLKLKLKDMLENNVDEKYYLSDKSINGLTNQMSKDHKPNLIDIENEPQKPFSTITCGYMKQGHYETYLKINNKSLQKTLEKNNIDDIDDIAYIDSYNKKIRQDSLANTITTRVSASNNDFLLIKNATKKGYLEAEDGDGIDISSRMEHHRGTVQKSKTQTITTMGGENNGVVVGTYQYAKSDAFMNGKDRLQLGKETSDTLQTTQKEGIVNSDLRIRKLTPRECFKLMGVKDEDFDKVKKNQSDASLYHLAGDSIVTNCLCAIFSQLIDK